MIIRNDAVEAYRDRTGQNTMFNQAIDFIGVLKHGKGWKGPISRYGPKLIPNEKSKASINEVLYAADIIRVLRPYSVIEQAKYDDDESWIGTYKPFDLHISQDDWSFAHVSSASMYEQQSENRQQVMDLLDIFGTAAATGKLSCRVQRINTPKSVELASDVWNADNNVLWSRYASGCMNPLNPLSDEDGRYMILVDTKDLHKFRFPESNPILESLEDARERLIKAAEINPYVNPKNDMKAFVNETAQKTGLNPKKARAFINEIPGQSWGTRGRRKDEHKNLGKEIHRGEVGVNNNNAPPEKSH